MKTLSILLTLLLALSFTNTSYAERSKPVPTQKDSSIESGTFQIINNESFNIHYILSSNDRKFKFDGSLLPGEKVELDVSHFKDEGTLIVVQIKTNKEGHEQYTPENPYQWRITKEMFKQGRILYTKKAYLPMEFPLCPNCGEEV